MSELNIEAYFFLSSKMYQYAVAFARGRYISTKIKVGLSSPQKADVFGLSGIVQLYSVHAVLTIGGSVVARDRC